MANNVQTTLNFIPADLPVQTMNGTSDFYTYANDKRPVTIYDVRGQENEFTLPENGFQYTTHRSACIPISDSTIIKSDLYAETDEFLKNTLFPQPTYIKIASHTIRSSPTDLNSEYTGTPGPARAAHLDHTPTGAKNYLYEKLPHEEASQLIRTRWAIVNVWRPLKPIKRDPLAVCDGSTLQEGDLMPIQMDYSASARAKEEGQNLRTTVGWEIAMARYSEGQRWYYLSDMGVDEVLLMKIFDSISMDKIRGAVHSSFEDPDQKDVKEVRESIELRCLVFWEDEPSSNL
ncbi:hypothetical protein BDW59DRAFT_160234 [Aspergillus cavernicola]|uniref:Methyltransferase n=1 Tax=Aspergillus cavernicola TaxID=176166 RepID=A0ABR4IIL9_9EURO